MKTRFGVCDLRLCEAKRGFHLIKCYLARNARNIFIECAAHIIIVAKDESFFEIKSTSNYIAGIFSWEGHGLLGFELVLEQKFLVVYDHRLCRWNRYWGTSLKPVNCMTIGTWNTSWSHLCIFISAITGRFAKNVLGENKWNHMSEMHTITAWSPSSIKIKWFSLFISVQNLIKFSTRGSDLMHNLAIKPLHLCEKNIPRRKNTWGRCPVSCSNRSSNLVSILLVPNWSTSLS